MNNTIIIWHNKACSTSRKALELIQNKHSVEIIDYLKNPPSTERIKEVLKMMGNQKPSYILRKKDKAYQENFVDKNLSDDEWIEAMHQNPSIIERPIVIINNKAYLARPFDIFATNFENL